MQKKDVTVPSEMQRDYVSPQQPRLFKHIPSVAGTSPQHIGSNRVNLTPVFSIVSNAVIITIGY
jgi:hypothetical protein